MGRRTEEQQPSLGTGTTGGPWPPPNVPSAHGPLQLSSRPTPETASSFRQYPAPRSLPQIQGEQGGAEGQTGVGVGAAPTPGSSLLLPPAPSVSGVNLRFPPALKIVLAARLSVPLATSCWIGSCQVSGLGLPLHPHNSQLSSEELGRPHRLFLGAPGPPRP